MAALPPAGHTAVKERVNANVLATVEDFPGDSDLLGARAGNPDVQSRIRAAIKHGVQTREAELTRGPVLSDLG